MWLQIILGGIFSFLVMKWWQSRKLRGDLNRMPGPTKSNLLWSLISGAAPDPYKTHTLLATLADKYGPVYKLSTLSDTLVIASDFDSIYQVTLKDAKEFGGRPTSFRLYAALQHTGILASYEADTTWKTLRKTCQRHLKQFGEGMNRLENIISTIAEDMFEEFANKSGDAFDPKKIVFDTALNSIAFLIAGERTRSGDKLVEMMREYESLFFKCLPVTVSFGMQILDVFPWLRHFGFPSWRVFQRFLKLEADIWKMVNEMNDINPGVESICRVLREDVTKDPKPGSVALTETDARKSSLSLLLAGVTTTSRTFYALVNILAHNIEVQNKLSGEIKAVTKNTRDVALEDKNNMPYARATVLETLRYVSIVPTGVRHRTVREGKLHGYTIPANTVILANQWALHHDAKFWKDPFVFRPERFLDEHGAVVPADHPNRKRLMPFGAGLRVCLGESLANTRLFLWVTTLVQRFNIRPANGNHKESTDPREFRFEGVLRPIPYRIIFTKNK